MKKLIILFALILLSCSSGGDTSSDGEILENVLTLELSFGDDDTTLPEEYLLARPRGLLVRDNGNIYVLDEDMLKVYNSSGEHLKIVGSPGQGPGEFNYARYPRLTPEGMITVLEMMSLSFFDKDDKFISKISTNSDTIYKSIQKQEGLMTMRWSNVYAITEDERYEIATGMQNPPSGTSFIIHYMLYHKKKTSFNSIYSYDQNDMVIKDRNMGIVPYKSGFHQDILSDNKFVYTHIDGMKITETQNFQYCLNIYDPLTEGSSQIIRQYTPVEIPDSTKQQMYDRYSNEERIGKDIADIVLDQMNTIKYLPPVSNILTDGMTIFVFTYNRNENKEYLVDIYDAEDNRYLRSAYFSERPSLIKNGAAYSIFYGSEDAFPQIRLYKIDPKVYER